MANRYPGEYGFAGTLDRAVIDRQRILKRLDQQEQQNERLRQENEELRRQLAEALRAAKRQAAPFRKAQKKNPQKPGRKRGAAYGLAHCRSKPQPQQVSETLRAALPKQCPHCGGAVRVEKVAEQIKRNCRR